MITFVGTHQYSIDDKGRLSVPARFRDAIARAEGKDADAPISLFITVDTRAGQQPILLAYPEARYNEIIARLSEGAGQQTREVRRWFAANTMECVIDKQCRIVVPAELRNSAQLKREVSVIGAGPNFEIWDRAEFQAQRLAMSKLPTPDSILL